MPVTEKPIDTAPVVADPLPVVLLGLGELTELFDVAKMSVYRWRSQASFPKPVVTVSGTPLFTLEQIEAFAKSRGMKMDRRALRRIAKSQGH